MIIYFADRNLNILGSASTGLPDGLVLSDDTKKESIASGSKTFNCRVGYTQGRRDELESMAVAGNFLLRSHEDCNEFYTIIESEFDTQSQTVQIYCEDAGLDLLNTQAPTYKATSAMSAVEYIEMFIDGTGWEIGTNETAGGTQKLEWDSEGTVTERLISIANSFGGCELSYSYEIEGMAVTHRYINMYEERGNKAPTVQLRLGADITRISTKKSVANLATAFTCEGNSSSINLNGCKYGSDGETTHDVALGTDDYVIVGKQVRCLSAMEKWAGVLDRDGLIVRQYTYDTKNKKELFSHAVEELQKVTDVEITYEIEFSNLDAEVGDWIYIVDDEGELYLQARILELETSVCNHTHSAVLGDYVMREAGMAQSLIDMSKKITTLEAVPSIQINSSNGTVFSSGAFATVLTVKVFFGSVTCESLEELEDTFGEGASLTWYEDGTEITDSRLSDNNFTLTLSGTLDGAVAYECVLNS